MKKEKDESLILQGLKNIRIAFLFQTLGILAILIYDGFTHGIMNVTRNNPLWLVFMATTIILGYLNMGISFDIEKMNGKSTTRQMPFYAKILLALAIGTVIFLIMIFSGSSINDSVITGIVISVSFIIAYSISHYLRKKRNDDK
ncbi:MAG TPA: branched-chain amino acid ABC transporter substrate-binding protein [Bacillales bacterium]|nr:branched-chain amino acid ABC transporter substrate-binding protein [Bacillales bacterium]